jgi:hypothetical protein
VILYLIVNGVCKINDGNNVKNLYIIFIFKLINKLLMLIIYLLI